MTLTMAANENCQFSVQPVDSAGNPTMLPAGAVAWTSSDPTVATVAPSADGMTVTVTATGKVGTADVNVMVTVNGTTLTSALTVTVGFIDVASISIVPSAPAAIPGAPTPVMVAPVAVDSIAPASPVVASAPAVK